KVHLTSVLVFSFSFSVFGVLISGGFNESTRYLASAELYDPANGIWTATGSLGDRRWFHTATLLPNGNVLVAGGSNSGGYLVSAELYDPGTPTPTPTGTPSATPRPTQTPRARPTLAPRPYTA